MSIAPNRPALSVKTQVRSDPTHLYRIPGPRGTSRISAGRLPAAFLSALPPTAGQDGGTPLPAKLRPSSPGRVPDGGPGRAMISAYIRTAEFSTNLASILAPGNSANPFPSNARGRAIVCAGPGNRL